LPNVSGNVFVITEATTRTGIAAARNAAELGGEVILLDTKSNFITTGTLEKLEFSVPHGDFVRIDCDFRDFQSVRRAIRIINGRYNKVYCLMNGAGTVPNEEKIMSQEGKEQEQIHQAHILLASEVIPLLEAHAREAGDARILNHSSIGYLHAAKHFMEHGGDLHGDGTKIMGGEDFHCYLEPRLANSTMRARTAFKKSHIRPGTPLLVLARFVRIKAKGTETPTPASKSTHFVYTGIY